MILSSGHSAAVKIEDKKGRAIEVEIIEADKETVKVKKTSDEKVFILQRNTLSPDSNTLIDEFLETSKEEEARKNIGKVEVIVKGGPDLGSWKFRMKPNRVGAGIEPAPPHTDMIERDEKGHPPFSRPPIRPHGYSRGRPPKAIS